MEAHDVLLTVAEFAERLRKRESGVRRWLLERRITSIKIGRSIRIPSSEVDRLIEEGTRLRREMRHGQ